LCLRARVFGDLDFKSCVSKIINNLETYTYSMTDLVWNKSKLGHVARFFAFEVYKRKYRCEKCGKDTRLAVHHKDGNRMNNTDDNLRVLCNRHHSEIHGWKYNPAFEEIDKEMVIQMYTIENASYKGIQDRCNCSYCQILKILKNAGIPLRKSRATLRALERIKRIRGD
jgi:hypothetical protein